MLRDRHRGESPRIRTMGQAEEIGYRLLVVGGAILGARLLSSLTLVLLYPGLELLALGAILILADIAWMFTINRRMTEEVFCPECHKRNVVLQGIPSFRCDDCGELIVLQTAPQPVDASGPAHA